MESEQKIVLAHGQTELTLRQGQAEKINEPVKYSNHKISLQTIYNYISGNAFLEKVSNNAVVTYSVQPNDMHILFVEDINDELSTSLKATLQRNPDYDAFMINTDRYFGGKQLITLARRYAHCFDDRKAPEALIKALQNFEIKFEQIHKEADDRKGNVEKSIKSALQFVNGEVPLTWKLNMPLFKGGPKVEFEIGLEIEAQHGSPVFGFFSLEAELLLRTAGEEIVRTEVAKFEEHFVVLETV